MSSRRAVIIDAVRTPFCRGREGGALSGIHPVDLYAQTLSELISRTQVDPAIIEDVITTGKSSLECVSLIKKANAKLLGFASIIDRSTKKTLKIKTGITSHLKIDVPTSSKNKLPLSLKAIPITTPGSRFIK